MDQRNIIRQMQRDINDLRQRLATRPTVPGRGAGVPDTISRFRQAAHGLAVGNVVRHDGTEWVKSQADTAANAVVGGVVVVKISADEFVLATSGYVAGLTGLTAGSVHYLDAATAGDLTTTAPSIAVPIIHADSATSGVLHPRGGDTGTSPTYPWVQLAVYAGQTLISSPSYVFGIERYSGESKPTAWIHLPRIARATALMGSGGTVVGVNITDRGSCYLVAPTVTVGAPPGGGTQAVITAAISDGKSVEGVYITDCGTGYAADEVPDVIFSAGGTTTAQGTAIVRDGKVVRVSLVSRGSGYVGTDTVTITAPAGGGTTATATAVMVENGIDLTITDQGAGYTSPPTITIAADATAKPIPTPPDADPPVGSDYADGVGWGRIAAGSLSGSLVVGLAQLIVHDDRSLVAWGLVGVGAALPNSRPADSVVSWYETYLRLSIADADADGVIPAWVPMGVA